MKGFYDVVFITTFVDKAHIGTLISSISTSNNTLRVLVVVACQNGYDIPEQTSEYVDVRRIKIPNIVSLSKARNICLCYLKEHNLNYNYIMFPDDDSVFDESFFRNFTTYVKGNTLIAVKATQDRQTYFIKMPNKQFASQGDFHKAISVNMVIKGNIMNLVGGFDEQLGVGNYYGAGEDNDFFIRCNKIENFTFTNSIWNYHPLQYGQIKGSTSQLKKRYNSYGRGVVYMLMKHRMFRQAMFVIIRGYVGCIISIIKLNFKMAYVYCCASNERLKTFIKSLYRLC